MYDAQKKYDKNNTVQLKLKLNRKTDADLIEWLSTLDNKQGTIKQILREEMRNRKLVEALVQMYGEDWEKEPAEKLNAFIGKVFPDDNSQTR